MRNDFTKRECRIQEQMAEVFQRMAEDSTIEFPKPDLSFIEEGTVPGAAEAAGGENEVYPKRRFGFLRRTGAVLCILCAVFVASSGLAVLISDQEAYAGNPVMTLFSRFINSIKSEQGKSNYYVEEGVENILITDEEQVILAKQSLSELAILENMSDQYKFQSLDLNLYENGMYTYTYIYNDQLNPDHPLHIDAAKREKNAQITIFGQSEHMVLPSLEADFYYQYDYTTGGQTGICIVDEQIITISGALSQEQLIHVAKSLKY